MKTTNILSRKRYYKNGSKFFEAWFNSIGERYMITVKKNEFIRGKWNSYDDYVEVFDYAGKTYCECGINHYNAHFSNYRDKSVIYGVYLRKVEQI